MKLKITSALLLCLLALLVSNCTNDEALSVMDRKLFSALEVEGKSTLSIEELKNDPIFLDLVESQKIEDILKEKTKIIELNEYTFKINSKSINKFSKKDYVSYTFSIDRGKGSIGLIENLIIENDGGKKQTYILSYILDDDWIMDYINNKSLKFKGKVAKEILKTEQGRNARIMSCDRIYIDITILCPRTTRAPGDKLDCIDENQVISIEVCGGGTGGPSFYDPQGEPGVPSGGGGGYTVMNGLDAQTMAVTLIKHFLGIPPYDPTTPSAIDWFAENPEVSKELLLYLIASNFSLESMTFGNWAKNHIYANGSSGIEVVKDAIQLMNTDVNLVEADIIDAIANQLDYRSGMPSSEQTIFDGMSSLNQVRYLVSAKQAQRHAEKLYPANTLINGLGDAFRHAYWNALCVNRIGMSLTISLTTAHEDHYDTVGYTYYQKDKDMDLFNNDVGRGLSMHGFGELPDKVQQAVSWGTLRYLSPLGAMIGTTWYPYAANASSVLKPTDQ